jgi:hypothetical protein
MRNFYKPGWHFPIDNNLMIENPEDKDEPSRFNSIRDIKFDIITAIRDEGQRIENEAQKIHELETDI